MQNKFMSSLAYKGHHHISQCYCFSETYISFSNVYYHIESNSSPTPRPLRGRRRQRARARARVEQKTCQSLDIIRETCRNPAEFNKANISA